MYFGRNDVEDAASVAVGRLSAGLFGEESNRVALVEQTDFAVWRRCGTRIDVNATLEQIPVEIGNQRTDIARGIRTACRLVNLLNVFDVPLYSFGEFQVVALVNRVDLALFGSYHQFIRHAELTD